MSLQASSSLPEAILASEDPASEEESSEAVAAPADGAKTEDIDPPEKSENEATAKEKSGGKVEAKSGGKKSKNSYSIAALCQVARLFLCLGLGLGQRLRNYFSCCCSPFGSFPHLNELSLKMKNICK